MSRAGKSASFVRMIVIGALLLAACSDPATSPADETRLDRLTEQWIEFRLQLARHQAGLSEAARKEITTVVTSEAYRRGLRERLYAMSLSRREAENWMGFLRLFSDRELAQKMDDFQRMDQALMARLIDGEAASERARE